MKYLNTFLGKKLKKTLPNLAYFFTRFSPKKSD